VIIPPEWILIQAGNEQSYARINMNAKAFELRVTVVAGEAWPSRFWTSLRFPVLLGDWTATVCGASRKRPRSGGQSCRKRTLQESGMSPKNDSNFLTYKTPEFLDNVCHQNVATRVHFAQIESGYMSDFRPKDAIFRNVVVFNEQFQKGTTTCQAVGYLLPRTREDSCCSSVGARV